VFYLKTAIYIVCLLEQLVVNAVAAEVAVEFKLEKIPAKLIIIS